MNKRHNIAAGMLILLILLIGAALYIWHGQQPVQQNVQEDDENSNIITHNGKKYKLNPDVKALLFLGIDRSEKTSVASVPGYGGQSDTILVPALNNKTKKAKILEISRDTMTNIKIYDESGSFLTKEKAQIALQYAYGDSTRKSSQYTKNTVSDFLYGLSIQSYITLDVDGVPKIVDAIGGVKIRVPADYTQINPAFTEGAELTLNGEQAESYIRYRNTDVTGSNDDRMNRQNQFMTALIEQLKGMDADQGYELLQESAGDYLDTDMNAVQIKNLAEYTFAEQVITIPGEMKAGEKHDEFYADDEKLLDNVVKLFYKPLSK